MILFCGSPFVIPISPNEKKTFSSEVLLKGHRLLHQSCTFFGTSSCECPSRQGFLLILDSWEKNDMMKLPWHFRMRDRFLFFLGSPFMAGYSFTAWTLYQSWRVQDVTTILQEDCKICGSCSLSEAVLLVWPVDLFSLIKVCWSFVVRKAIHKFWFATKQGHLLELYTQLAVTSFDRISVCVCNMLLSLLALSSLFDMFFFTYICIYIYIL